MFIQTANAQPANDNCNTSQNLSRQLGSNCSSTFSATTAAATASSQTAIFNTNKDDDIWFDFTLATGQTQANISVSNIVFVGSSVDLVFELWTSDCNTRLPYSYLGGTAGNFTWDIVGITAGDYKVRAYTNNTTSRVSFNICFLAGPTNDDCSNAAVLTPVSGVTCTGTDFYSTMQATPSTQSSGDGTGKDDDVWFQFTTPASTYNYTVDLSDIVWSSPSGNPVIELWQNCTEPTYISWYPFASSASLGSLTPNTNYKIRVYSYGTSFRFSSFKICVRYQVAPPGNDTYAAATTITLSSAVTCTNILTGGSTANSTPDNIPTCSGAPAAATANDVWYKFTATNAQATIKLVNKTLLSGTNNLMWLQVYESSNTNLKLCAENNTADSVVFDASTTNKTLILGTTYYLRVYNHDPASACSYNICSYMPKGPTYDECALAVNLLVSSNEFCNNSIRLSNANTSSSAVAAPPCAANAYNDIWLRFVAPTPVPSTGLRISIQNFELLTGSNPNLRYAIYSGNCGTLSYLTCDALPALTAGNTYYIRIFSASGSGTGNFDVCLAPLPATQTNTTCATAITLTATSDQSASFTSGSTYGLTQLSTITDCFNTTGSPNKVLWYKFVATATSHFVEFSNMVTLSTNANSLGYRVTTGACPTTTALAPPICIFGVNNQNSIISGLTVGQTYFIEVMENTFNGGPVSFNMRIIGTGAPANDEAAGATTIIQQPTCSVQNGSFKFSTLSSSSPATMGAAAYYQDVWYKFTAASSTVTIKLAGRLAIPRIALYNAAGTTIVDAGAEAYSYTATGLTVGQLYNIRILNTSATSSVNPTADFTICVSGVPSTTLAVGPTPSTCLTNDNTVISSNSQRWLHFTRGGGLIASVFDGANMGNMVAKYFINAGAIRSNAGVEYLDRNLEITPTTQPTTPVAVRLYFSKAEFEAYINANDADGNDAYWLNDLKVAKFSSLNCQNIIGTTGEVMYGIAGFGALSADVYYLDIIVPDFSGFYIKNVSSGTPLPVACNQFTYKLSGNTVQLQWSTFSEANNSHFELQRSTNGVQFNTVVTIPASTSSNTVKNYQYNDFIGNTATVFYRIKQVDKDGKEQFVCRILKVNSSRKNDLLGMVYPNPVKDVLLIDLQKNYAGKINVQVLNAVGQIVSQKNILLSTADTQLTLNTSMLAKGMYALRVVTADGVFVKQFSKQ